MKHYFGILIFVISGFCACASQKPLKTENRNVEAFAKISVEGGIDVIYTASDKLSLSVEAPEDIIENITTIVTNGVLEISLKNASSIRVNDNTKVYISAPTLEAINLSGASDFNAKKLENAGNILINLSGSSDLEIRELTATDVLIDLSGSSDIEIEQLTAKKCQVNTSGASDIDMNINTETITVDCSGASDVELKGNTNQISITCSGSSDVNIRKLTYQAISEKTTGGSDIRK